jgi:hypothetical protein
MLHSSYLKVGKSFIFLIPSQEGKVFAVKPGRNGRAVRMALDPLELLKALPYFSKRAVSPDLADLLCQAGNRQSFEPMTADQLWSAWHDSATEAIRLLNDGDREGARRLESQAVEFRVRHQRIVSELRQKEVDSAGLRSLRRDQMATRKGYKKTYSGVVEEFEPLPTLPELFAAGRAS